VQTAPPTETSTAQKPSGVLLAAVLAGILVIWCFNYVAGKMALRRMDPFTLASIRIEIAALLMLAIHFARRERRRFRPPDAWTFLYLGFFGVILNQGGYTVGLNYTTSERSVVMVAITPIVVLVLARWLGLEKLTPLKITGMLVATAGVLLLETEHGSLGHAPLALGDFITFLGVVGFSVFSVLGKRVMDPTGQDPNAYDAISFNTFTLVAAALLLLPLAIRQGMRLDWRAAGVEGWGGLLYMAIFSSVIAYTLFYWVLRYMEASRVAAIDYFQPFIVIFLSVLFLNEHPTGHILSGGALVVAGVYLVEKISSGAAVG
jgi:drug/metabolite transporter (DMT)-like permease